MDNFALTVPSFETLKIFFLNPWTGLFLFVFAIIGILRSIKDFWDPYDCGVSIDWANYFLQYLSPGGLIMSAYQMNSDCILSEDLSFVERFLIFISYYSFALWIISHLVRSIWLI
ncbi:TPA: hypothetical protein DCZ46_01880 [Candidatus Campbellbacteria bacterium]|nr:MAG: hypothetical protein UR74_C0001G0027 [Candidatus Campbellbacteria bacterium GW2011_GWD2_35_24]KKP76268.1 MAG: hypothetical protein UR75_C0001G0302 [Candidatus Campbellbacteria bacterium GW2011_GWC2_35_28]KKP77457.1 MAG: hypothetical protein UR76_C0001G0302 [Candidatus Campbellbacteria bacterium GW2011_GWC1_35_31]KKP79386.1 MAG: hypothetical protein UR79_C0001G0302 [Candidatus Campbellbacteria bacterium GW2011_GWD1_35_49]HAP73997.1 hypothetical protein [Candidatus Campbellbacteria bacter